MLPSAKYKHTPAATASYWDQQAAAELKDTAGLAVGLLNAPFGAAREHVPKFSPEWFVAVHATIPFVAALRKALLMPRWAVALTVASAIAGQLVGSRLERKRLLQHKQQAEEQQAAAAVESSAGPRLSIAFNTSSSWRQPQVQLQPCSAAYSSEQGSSSLVVAPHTVF